jgi:hypothetical protein
VLELAEEIESIEEESIIIEKEHIKIVNNRHQL